MTTVRPFSGFRKDIILLLTGDCILKYLTSALKNLVKWWSLFNHVFQILKKIVLLLVLRALTVHAL